MKYKELSANTVAFISSNNVYRHEWDRGHTLPFFLTFFTCEQGLTVRCPNATHCVGRSDLSVYSQNLNLPQGRILFEVTLEGSARKLVTVRSALVLKNTLQEVVDVKLENNLVHPGGKHSCHHLTVQIEIMASLTISELWLVTATKTVQVHPGGVLPVPLSHVMSYLWVRPSGHGYVFCNKPVTWSHVSRPGETLEELYMCISNRDQSFRYSSVAWIRVWGSSVAWIRVWGSSVAWIRISGTAL